MFKMEVVYDINRYQETTNLVSFHSGEVESAVLGKGHKDYSLFTDSFSHKKNKTFLP